MSEDNKHKELYKRTFSKVRSSRIIKLEEKEMKEAKVKNFIVKLAITAAAVGLAFGVGNVVTYAAEGNSLIKTISIWINGEKVEEEIEFKENTWDGEKYYYGTFETESNDDASENMVISIYTYDIDNIGEFIKDENCITYTTN